MKGVYRLYGAAIEWMMYGVEGVSQRPVYQDTKVRNDRYLYNE